MTRPYCYLVSAYLWSKATIPVWPVQKSAFNAVRSGILPYSRLSLSLEIKVRNMRILSWSRDIYYFNTTDDLQFEAILKIGLENRGLRRPIEAQIRKDVSQRSQLLFQWRFRLDTLPSCLVSKNGRGQSTNPMSNDVFKHKLTNEGYFDT